MAALGAREPPISALGRACCSPGPGRRYVGATVRHETLRFGQSWARIAPWRGHAEVAQLVVGPDSASGRQPRSGSASDRARDRGYRSVVTGAVSEGEAEPFLAAGLTVREHLHLLARDLLDEPAPPELPTARATVRDRKPIVALDDAAFEPFWRLGAAGMRDALDATPKSRFRVGRIERRSNGGALPAATTGGRTSAWVDASPGTRSPGAPASTGTFNEWPSTPTPASAAGDAHSLPTPSRGSGSITRPART